MTGDDFIIHLHRGLARVINMRLGQQRGKTQSQQKNRNCGACFPKWYFHSVILVVQKFPKRAYEQEIKPERLKAERGKALLKVLRSESSLL